ncbi:restriction endonuclease subunit S [Mycoplasma sp. Pen4]|uniref:restriction endonuclease subunit S n=1 Tax=Mycoplasma sp. Pen4 TaxID=640330 RepID=UPI00351C3D5C
MYYLLLSKSDDIQKLKSSGSVPTIRSTSLKELEIIIPSISTQNKIVEILDNFNSISNDITNGLPKLSQSIQKQYEYYRDLIFKWLK